MTRRIQVVPAVVASIGAILLTGIAFWVAVGSIHDPSRGHLIICLVASPFATMIFLSDASVANSIWYSAIAAGFLLWLLLLYVIVARLLREAVSP